MARCKINDITVDMPFEPYESQIQTMEKIILCLKEGTTGMIESPTGTGKSLSIICSVLAYKEHFKRNYIAQQPPGKKQNTTEVKEKNERIDMSISEVGKKLDQEFKIIICSRTHKQLDQLVQQLNKTRYRPRISILASRSQYCINPVLKSVSDKNDACTRLVKNNECGYFVGKDRLAKIVGQRIFDIEEIVREGRKCRGCPYFASRKLNDDADIIFAPYNYLLDSKVRDNSNIDLSKCIVIIDEAHNIDDICRSSGSLELSSKVVDITCNELLNAVKKSAFLGSLKNDFFNLLEMFKKFRDFYNQPQIYDKNSKNQQARIRKGNEIKKEIEKIGMTKEFMTIYKNSLYSINKEEDAKTLLHMATWSTIESVDSILSALLFSACDVYSYAFIKTENFSNQKTFSYNFWLMDSAYVFQPFVKNVRSLILLSGTLSPFISFSSELGHKFEHQLCAKHLVTEKQVFISCLKRGHLKSEIIGTYKISDSLVYLDQVSKVIFDITHKVTGQGGTLVFVPSYTFLDNLYKRLKLLKLDNLFLEPKAGGQQDFEEVLNKYHNRVSLKKPVCLMCVYRGKASEGMDFKDNSARAVICVGIPYPSFVDPQIGLKKEYNDKYKHFNGRRWYETQAFRAVNQAAGRAIRHKDDWGVIFMLDSRYQDKRISGQLSGWVNQFLKVYDNYDACLNNLNLFLEDKNVKK